ncbi:hypothetical protein ABZY81_36255 [Streptomyces sp. NPDC006514]
MLPLLSAERFDEARAALLARGPSVRYRIDHTAGRVSPYGPALPS